MVYTINCVSVCNACSGQNYCYAWCFLFYLPTKLQKDELCHLSGSVATALVIDLWCSYSTHPITQQFAFSPLLSFLFKQKHFPSSLLNKSYLKTASTDRSFGKQYYGYAKGTISLSPSSLMYVVYAQKLVCDALGCNV